MFIVEEYNSSIEAKVLRHSANVFHEALGDGDRYYHVTGDGVQYDILYKGNTEWFGDRIPTYVGMLAPEYLQYDELDSESMDLEFLNSFAQFVMLKVTEYSVAVARAVLRFTDKLVYFADSRAEWFLEPSDRLHIGEMPAEDDNTVFLVGALGGSFSQGSAQQNKVSDIIAFHSLYILQNMFAGKERSRVKYFEYPMSGVKAGIGGLLMQTASLVAFAKGLGLEVCYNGTTVGKFKIADLKRYYKLDFKRDDNTEDNTVGVESITYLNIAWRFNMAPCELSAGVLQEKFYSELEEYADAVIKGRKALGILIRGTDYKVVGFSGTRVQASVDDMLPMIREWLKEDGYEVIVLATEDKDVLDQMRGELGDMVVAIAQERHSVSEFEKGQIINELEKQIYTEKEYDDRVIDTTINYYYALHLLSRCDAFMCSGQNNGWDTVNAMNGGKFERKYKFMIDCR